MSGLSPFPFFIWIGVCTSPGRDISKNRSVVRIFDPPRVNGRFIHIKPLHFIERIPVCPSSVTSSCRVVDILEGGSERDKNNISIMSLTTFLGSFRFLSPLDED